MQGAVPFRATFPRFGQQIKLHDIFPQVIVLCAGLISAGGLLAAHSNLMTATTTVHTTNSNSSSLSAAVAAAAAAAAGLRAFEETLMSRETTAQPTQTEERDEFCTSLSSWGEEVLSAVSGREDAVFFTETDIEAEAVPGVKMCAYESAARQNPKRPVVRYANCFSRKKIILHYLYFKCPRSFL